MESLIAADLFKGGAGAAVDYFFAYKEMGTGAGGYLRHVGNGNYLTVLAQRLHLLSYGRSDLASDVGIDFVEDQQADQVLLG
jgi:hypothetical protein